VPGKTIKSYQLKVYMNAREIGLTQVEAAVIAEFSERSAQRIEAGTHQPQRGTRQPQRSAPDPLASVWEQELEPMLRQQPRLRPMTLFEYLQERYPGQYEQVLRTLQRRVREWKALYGASPEVMFPLRHEPGELGLSDFTQLKGVQITIGGKGFEHLIYHYRLAYSGWQYAQIIQGGESFVALAEGLQNALADCGGVPRQHRTDSLSAAYRNVQGKSNQPLTELYDQLCRHYRMQPTRNNRGVAHENGAIESSHGPLKRRIEQALLLRGSAEFATVQEYQSLIDGVVERLNGRHQAKVEQEKLALGPLPTHRVPDYEVVSVRVSCHSTITVRCMLYTVPSRLIGRKLELHLYHDRMVGYLNQQLVVELPRIRSTDKTKRRARCINYRHVVEGLRRKPRALLYCLWQQELLPNDAYRQLWQQMQARYDPDSAAVLMVEALYIAATQDKEAAVAEYLAVQLAAGPLTLVGLQQQFGLAHPAVVPDVNVTQHPLQDYDQLLSSRADPTAHQSLPEPEPEPQATAPVSYAQAVGTPGPTSGPGGLVPCSVFALLFANWRCSIAIPPASSAPWQKPNCQTQKASPTLSGTMFPNSIRLPSCPWPMTQPGWNGVKTVCCSGLQAWARRIWPQDWPAAWSSLAVESSSIPRLPWCSSFSRLSCICNCPQPSKS
jgi:hypothetical protein